MLLPHHQETDMIELTREQFVHELATLLGMPMAVEFSCGDGPTEDEVQTQHDLILSHDAALRAKVEALEKENARLNKIEDALGEAALTLQDQLAAMRQERNRLKEALAELYTYQNGCPLPSYEYGWTKAMEMTEAALRGETGGA